MLQKHRLKFFFIPLTTAILFLTLLYIYHTPSPIPPGLQLACTGYAFSLPAHCPVPKQLGNKNYFSQNFEDYILSIVFKDEVKGIYIDVGAWNPDVDSVTKYFYLRGWRGINIEPIPEYHALFKTKRPADINLNIGIADKKSQLTFYKVGNTGLSTFDANIAATAQQNHFPYTTFTIPTETLSQVIKKHQLTSIDFINIDVEGFEKQVLQGLNLKSYRPKVFIIEAITPITSKPSHQAWENILLENGYKLAFFDGLNRYYVSNEAAQLMEKFLLAGKCACRANKITKPFAQFSEMYFPNQVALTLSSA